MANKNSYIKMALDGDHFDFSMDASEEDIVLMFFNLLQNDPSMLNLIASACSAHILKSADDEKKSSLN